MLTVSEAWKSTYPGAAVGMVVMRNVLNPDRDSALDRQREELGSLLRSRFASYDRAALKALPILQAYDVYFRRYKKTYHLQLQLESVAIKGASIPRASAIIEAMFLAELKNLLLTAGHDLEAIEPPLRLDISRGVEQYTLLNGQEQMLKPDDMMIADARGVISSVLYGPDNRTRIRPETKGVFFTVYAPASIGRDAVYKHLEDIQANVLLVAPEAETVSLNVTE